METNGATQEPPHSVDAEQATLGCILLDPSACREIAAGLEPDDFYRPDHRLIAQAIANIARRAIPDWASVAEQLRQDGKLDDVGGAAYLRNLAQETPTAINVGTFAQSVRAYAARRRLLRYVGERTRPDDLQAMLEHELERLRGGAAQDVGKPLEIEPASTWASRPEPAPRDWIVDGLIPAARVTSLLGNGGLGKTLLAVQLGVHVSMNRPLFGRVINGGPVLGIFCEDEIEELERRTRAACAGEDIALESLERLHMTSRDGLDNLLCTFEREQIQFTPFYRALEATIAALKPRLTILDTAADLFGGDFISTPQVRQFLKVALGGLCVRHGTAVLLLAHPSASGMSSGKGDGFSTAWHNSVRSRLYLRRPDTEDVEAAKDRRVLALMKANLGRDGDVIPLHFHRGCFAPDPEPLEEGTRTARAPRLDTRLALAVHEQIRKLSPDGMTVVSFSAILKPLQAAGMLANAQTGAEAEKVRKTLQRVLRQLAADKVVVPTKVPRGYRLACEAEPAR
ncbi:MAG TPA: AAA family ATPase [Steroidobacteraceae bacterium]|nr:AAA family ATPase [Steroidobacteraceae bacterium]